MGRHPLYNNTGLQKNNKSHVLYALTSKYDDLKKEAEDCKIRMAKIKIDLIAMEQVIDIFDGKIDKKPKQKEKAEPCKISLNTIFDKGEARSFVLRVLRTSNEPMRAVDVAKEIQVLKGLGFEHKEVNAKVNKITNDTLRAIEKSGLISKVKIGSNYIALWEIKK